MPLYSGGLCDAVKLMLPSVLRVTTAYAIAGVGAASGITSGFTPCRLRMPAASATKVSPMKRGSRPTSSFGPLGLREATYRAMPVTARRTFSIVNSSATIARHPEVPNLICVLMRPSLRRTAAHVTDHADSTDSMDKPIWSDFCKQSRMIRVIREICAIGVVFCLRFCSKLRL